MSENEAKSLQQTMVYQYQSKSMYRLEPPA